MRGFECKARASALRVNRRVLSVTSTSQRAPRSHLCAQSRGPTGILDPRARRQPAPPGV